MVANRSVSVYAIATLTLAWAAAGAAFGADKRHPAELQGYWALQRATADGKDAGGGGDGTYLVVRGDGTYRIAKAGRKPEGRWEVNAENKLVLKVGDKVLLAGDWVAKGETLTLSYQEGKAKVVLTYLKKRLDKEPKAPDEK